MHPDLINLLKTHLSADGELTIQSIGGGSINEAYHVQSRDKSVFVKVNNANAYPGMFEAEARGLELLRTHSRFEIPKVLDTGEVDNTSYLIMDWIPSGTPDSDFWENFAVNLADLHRQNEEMFGLDHNNYIGSLPQQNENRYSWSEFYIEMRLEPQLRLARNDGLVDSDLIRSFDKLFARIENLFPEELPALIHGDLWSGNFICTGAGQATIFDPAVYYGHREMDLAMSKLFGGFDRAFFDHYNTDFPLENGWEKRIPLGQLYPLLVHVNLFGGGYVAQVKTCLRGFV